MKINVIPKTLHFKKPAGTSRGVYTERKVWYLQIVDGNRSGIGECAPLPKLSIDDVPDYETVLDRICQALARQKEASMEEMLDAAGIQESFLRKFPSIRFGLETAFRNLEGQRILWEDPFSRGEMGIPINGLIWMGSHDAMSEQIRNKLEQGFRCIKLKIAAIGFEEEMDLLQGIRSQYPASRITLRVDANGGFAPEEAMDRLERLAQLDLHSIEQPIMAGQWKEMARLCASSPLPIALDEELIPCVTLGQKIEMLDTICPQYLILKPSLHGGIAGCEEWIRLAKEREIGWWVTSALESNIGLNAIAQWCGSLLPIHGNLLPQGLGTGQLFTDNIDMGLEIIGDQLWKK